MQDLSLSPAQPVLGQQLTVTFRPPPPQEAAGVALDVVWAETGATTRIGKTDASGRLVWTPQHAGPGLLRAHLGGVDHVAQIVVFEPRSVFGFVVPWTIAALLLVYLTRRARRYRARHGDDKLSEASQAR